MTDHRPSDRESRSALKVAFLYAATLILLLVPFGLLVVLSLGSGWSFPHILPDRIDFAPWRHLAADRDGMLSAAGRALGRSVVVSLISTLGGLVAGRALRRRASDRWLFIVYLPFVLSPVVVGVCLYDLLVRMRLAGTVGGVMACQILFSFAYATVLFCELWTPRLERTEQLVRTLGGGRWAVWRHALLPQARGIILICLIQTALSSWLDYGIVAMIGGGSVKSLTLLLFSYIREASVNQAALSSLVMLLPALLGILVTGILLRLRHS
jgi:putative spermidine/putrescine transport system permease protein